MDWIGQELPVVFYAAYNNNEYYKKKIRRRIQRQTGKPKDTRQEYKNRAHSSFISERKSADFLLSSSPFHRAARSSPAVRQNSAPLDFFVAAISWLLVPASMPVNVCF